MKRAVLLLAVGIMLAFNPLIPAWLRGPGWGLIGGCGMFLVIVHLYHFCILTPSVRQVQNNRYWETRSILNATRPCELP